MSKSRNSKPKEIDTRIPYWLWDDLNKERKEVVKRYTEIMEERG